MLKFGKTNESMYTKGKLHGRQELIVQLFLSQGICYSFFILLCKLTAAIDCGNG